MSTTLTRRGLLGAALAAPLAMQPLSALAADPRSALTPSLQARLTYFARELEYDLTGLDDVEAQVFEGYARLRIPMNLLFDGRASARVLPSGIDILTAIAPTLRKAAKGFRAEIVAHLDGTTHDFETYMITRRRAEAVKAVLLSRNVPRNMPLAATGLGDLFPIAPHSSASIRENDRIEIILRAA